MSTGSDIHVWTCTPACSGRRHVRACHGDPEMCLCGSLHLSPSVANDALGPAGGAAPRLCGARPSTPPPAVRTAEASAGARSPPPSPGRGPGCLGLVGSQSVFPARQPGSDAAVPQLQFKPCLCGLRSALRPAGQPAVQLQSSEAKSTGSQRVVVPVTRETEAGRITSSRPAWAIKRPTAPKSNKGLGT